MSDRLVYLWERPAVLDDAGAVIQPAQRTKAVEPERRVEHGTVWAVAPLDDAPGRTLVDRARSTLDLARRPTDGMGRVELAHVLEARDRVHEHPEPPTRAGLLGAEIRWADETPEEAGE